MRNIIKKYITPITLDNTTENLVSKLSFSYLERSIVFILTFHVAGPKLKLIRLFHDRIYHQVCNFNRKYLRKICVCNPQKLLVGPWRFKECVCESLISNDSIVFHPNLKNSLSSLTILCTKIGSQYSLVLVLQVLLLLMFWRRLQNIT